MIVKAIKYLLDICTHTHTHTHKEKEKTSHIVVATKKKQNYTPLHVTDADELAHVHCDHGRRQRSAHRQRSLASHPTREVPDMAELSLQ